LNSGKTSAENSANLLPSIEEEAPASCDQREGQEIHKGACSIFRPSAHVRRLLMPPVSLSDSELTAIMDACRPLQPRDRDRFLRNIATELAALPMLGDGAVNRAIKAVWRQHFDAPDLRTAEGGGGKYR
jgi:hypothetical protein